MSDIISTKVRNSNIYDMTTGNISFIAVAKRLENLYVRNHDFPLELKNPLLTNVDPYAANLSDDEIKAIKTEVSENPWYFLREIVRVKMPNGVVEQLSLNNVRAAQVFCILNGTSQISTGDRQDGKSTLVSAMILWLMKYKKAKVVNVVPVEEVGKYNLDIIFKMYTQLPIYLKGNDVIKSSDHYKLLEIEKAGSFKVMTTIGSVAKKNPVQYYLSNDLKAAIANNDYIWIDDANHIDCTIEVIHTASENKKVSISTLSMEDCGTDNKNNIALGEFIRLCTESWTPFEFDFNSKPLKFIYPY